MSGYDEQSYIHPPTMHEVYGQDGYRWYTTPEAAQELFPKTETSPTGNPLYVNLHGMTAKKLRAKGFVK